MKLKLLIFILVLPIALSHARTNEFDTLLVQKGATVNSNLFVYEFISINTNASAGAGRSLTVRPRPGAVNNFIEIMPPVGAGSAALLAGDFVGAGTSVEFGTDGAGQVRIVTTAATAFNTVISGNTMQVLTPTTSTFGASASSIEIHNGTTATMPNGWNINSGIFIIPINTAGTITNGTDAFFLESINASNGVFRTVNGISSISSGTNLTMVIDSSAGAGTLQTQALFIMTTNTPSGTPPVVNTIYTNNASRLTVTAGVNIPTTVANQSAVALWSASGGVTNITAPVSGPAGVIGVITNFTIGIVQPNALYMVTNINVSAGAPTIIIPSYRETRW